MAKPLRLHRSRGPFVTICVLAALRNEPAGRAGPRNRNHYIFRGSWPNSDLSHQPRWYFGTSQILRPRFPAVRAPENTSVGGPCKNHLWNGPADLDGRNRRSVEFRRDRRPMMAIVGSQPQPAGPGPQPERLEATPHVGLHLHHNRRLLPLLL